LKAEKVYYHFVTTERGKFYLGYDYYMGYETLYDTDKKPLASKFYADRPFDKKDWLPESKILEEGVEEVVA
jgi:hypothetical protein